MLLHGNVISAIEMNNHPKFAILNFKDVSHPQEEHLSYLPLAHIFETININTAMYAGCAVGFYQGDPLKILEDLTALRPTFFVSVPRLYNRIYDKINTDVAAASTVKRLMFSRALKVKLAALHESGIVDNSFWDRLLFSKLQAGLGLDRCHTMITGSDPISSEVKDFMRVAIGVRMLEGYGLTETVATLTATHPDDLSNAHVGMPSTGAQIKLVDVPEMNYVSSADPPCGEICVRGSNVFLGYYKNPEKTAEDLEPNGWFHTCDVGSWTTERCLRIIDRKKNTFKLAQGEYAAAAKIENVLGRCSLVAQIFVYGDSLQSYLLAVVVPEIEEMPAWAKANSVPFSGALESLTQEGAGQKLAASILEQLKSAAAEARLAGFELPKRVYLEPELFSVDNGLLTPTLKMKRVELKKRYKSTLDSMYSLGLHSAVPTSKL